MAPPIPELPEEGSLVRGKYRLCGLLGDGGMGQVYEARHEVLGLRVALKFLHPRLARFPELTRRFLDEARLAAPIRSPHVVQVLDVDATEGGLAFIVLELLSGPTLRARIEARCLTVAEVRAFAIQLCDGLEAVHAAGIVHRDLKPENVMVTAGPAGFPVLKLLDFGVASPGDAALTSSGRASLPGLVAFTSGAAGAVGTKGYVAPEQEASPFAASPRADLFSLGVVLFEMLTGRLPGEGAVLEQIEALAPEAGPELAAVIARAISPEVAARFASAEEMRLALAPEEVGELSVLTSLTPVSPRASLSMGDAVPQAMPAGSLAGRPSRTSAEAPWFFAEPTPPPPSCTPSPSGFTPSPQPIALEAAATPPRRRAFTGLAVALALALGLVLGAGGSRLAPGREAGRGRSAEDLRAAMFTAPSAALTPDPAPDPAPDAVLAALTTTGTESAPTRVVAPRNASAGAPAGTSRGGRVASAGKLPPGSPLATLPRSGAPAASSSAPARGAAPPSPPVYGQPSHPAKALPSEAPAAVEAPAPNPWPGMTEAPPPRVIDPPASPPPPRARPGIVLIVPLGAPRGEGHRPRIQIFR